MKKSSQPNKTPSCNGDFPNLNVIGTRILQLQTPRVGVLPFVGQQMIWHACPCLTQTWAQARAHKFGGPRNKNMSLYICLRRWWSCGLKLVRVSSLIISKFNRELKLENVQALIFICPNSKLSCNPKERNQSSTDFRFLGPTSSTLGHQTCKFELKLCVATPMSLAR